MRRSRDFYDRQYLSEIYADGKYHGGDRVSWVQSLIKERFPAEPMILEIGPGRGHLQPLGNGYVGCDISIEAGRHFQKPFVCGTAEALPFDDQSFDLVISFTVLEHIIQPEVALTEMDRVLKKGGILCLDVAWRVPPWRPLGLEVRPYQNLNGHERVLKFCLPALNFLWTKAIFRLGARLLREVRFLFSNTANSLAFIPITPNWEEFLLPDSDAAASIDNHACALWLHSRGFQSSLTSTVAKRVFLRCGPLLMVKA